MTVPLTTGWPAGGVYVPDERGILVLLYSGYLPNNYLRAINAKGRNQAASMGCIYGIYGLHDVQAHCCSRVLFLCWSIWLFEVITVMKRQPVLV
jgi:hypothetical protein